MHPSSASTWLLLAVAFATSVAARPPRPAASAPASTPAPGAVVAWLREHAMPLVTVEAGHGFADLEPLARRIGAARVVALGESTHGTREFFQLKARLIEHLCTTRGFAGVAMEANMAESRDIDRWLATGVGDPSELIASLRVWPWKTEEVLAMLLWMRHVNETGEPTRRLRFFGIDMQSLGRPLADAVSYLEAADPAAPQLANPRLRSLASLEDTSKITDWPLDAKRGARAALASLAGRMESHRDEQITRSSEADWERARQDLRLADACLRWRAASGDASSAIRRSAMPANLEWILEHEVPGRSIVLWAHDRHVMKSRREGGDDLGFVMSRKLGPAYVAFRLAFSEGSFTARELLGPGRTGALRSFTVAPSPNGTIDEAFARAGNPLAAVDLRELPREGPVADWFRVPRPSRVLGATFSDSTPPALFECVLPDAYDGILFVQRTTASRLLPQVDR